MNTAYPLPEATAPILVKFYESNDDLIALEATGRRALFAFLRTKPNLTPEEVDDLEAISDLIAGLCSAQRTHA